MMFDIVINPLAGKGKSLATLKTIETILTGKEIEYTVHRTAYARHTMELVSELNNKDECNLIVMGGDGTFNEALNGIHDFDKITVGFIPCGSGNDYIKATDIPSDPKKALERILQNNIKYTDFIQLDEKRALNTAGAGIDVDTLVRYSTMKHFKAKVRYLLAFLDCLLHIKWHKMIVDIDGKKEEKSVFLTSVSNGKFIGGGLPICPAGIVDDGLFDVVIVKEIKKIKMPALLIKFLRGKILDAPCTEHYRCTEVHIELLDDGKTQVDGEVFENKILNCKLIHDTLKIFG